MKNIYETLTGLNYFSNLVAIIKKSGLEELLAQKKLTFLAPNNAAFGNASAYEPDDPAFKRYLIVNLDDILTDQDSASETLRRHLVPEILSFNELKKRPYVTPLFGEDLPIVSNNGDILIGGASIEIPDVNCTNGLIQVINWVYVPTIFNKAEA